MLVRVKNRTAHAILLTSASGDTIQLNASVTKDIDDSFLIDYDTKAIQVMQKKTVTVDTSPKAVSPSSASEEVVSKESKEAKESKKSK